MQTKEKLKKSLTKLQKDIIRGKDEYTSVVVKQAYENRVLQVNNIQLSSAFSSLRHTLSSLKLPIVLLDKDLKVKMITPSVEKRFNIPKKVIGKSIFDINFPVGATKLEEILKSILSNLTRSVRIVVKSEKGYWYSLRISPYRESRKHIDGVAMVFVGIDQLKKSLEDIKLSRNKLVKRERYFRALIEQSNDAIALRDVNAKILYVSPSNKRILGYKRKEFVGRNWYDFVHPDDKTSAMEWFNAVKKPPVKPTIISYRFLHKDGSFRWIEGSLSNMLEDPNVNAIVVNYRDVTDRKDLEYLKDEFASMSSHELRTPLANMRWKLESLLDEDFGEVNPTVKAEMKKLQTENQKLINLVNKLLDVSKVQTKSGGFRVQKVMVKPLVERIVGGFEKQIESKKINVSVNIYDHVVYNGDTDILSSIISNLIENSVKYNKDFGQVIVYVRDRGRLMEIEVVDTGIGISDADKTNIFKKFYRTREATKVMSGVGLGLYSTRLHVIRMGGKIDFKSSPGKGSKFKVILPKSQ